MAASTNQTRDLQLETISVIAELDRIGWDWEAAGDDEVRVRCPAHDDEHPSCGISLSKRLYKCQVPACGSSGDFVSFLCHALKQPSRRVIIEDLATRYPLEVSKVVSSEAVERWHAAIWTAAPMLAELRKRGVTDDDVRRYRIGFDGRRVTIPIPNGGGHWVNVRRYMPGAPGAEKMKNLRGHGEVRLYPLEQLKYDTVVVVGGEVKAIVTARILNPHGIGAITATGGEGNWEPEFSRMLRGKRTPVCFDVDDEGATAAVKVAARLKGDSRWVGVMSLPLDRDQYPHGDQNDYFGPEGRTGEDFLALLAATAEWSPPKPPEETGPADVADVPLLPLAAITESAHAGTRLRVQAVVTARADTPYLIPSVVDCSCDRSQDGCAACPVFAREPSQETGAVRMAVHRESPSVLAMVDAPKRQLREATREALRIPSCKSVQFRTVEHQNVEELRLTPQLCVGAQSQSQGDAMRVAFYVGHGSEANAAYEFIGRVYPHPKDQRAVMVASSSRPSEDSLTAFRATDAELQELALFQPQSWTEAGIAEKLDDLYSDLETNVTGIYGRRDLHLFIDLAYHSALYVPFDRRVVKGWTEILVIGDSGQGKTETSAGLMRHYGMGERVVCKASTGAGLLGGLEQIDGKWFVRWGVLPTHDRRLVIFEELKGVTVGDIAKLTDARTSGVAELTKIEKRKTWSRTRILAVTNPRSDRQMQQYGFGVEAVQELIGGLEDVRRFDACYVVTSGQVDQAKINVLQRERPSVSHRHTPELCRRLVLWAWTRGEAQVEMTEGATVTALSESIRMCDSYSDAIPLVDRGGMRHKLARLATALAARTYSCGNADTSRLVVRECHVRFVSAMLDRVYSSPEHGYRDFSRAMLSQGVLQDGEGIRSKLYATPYARDLVEKMLQTPEIDSRDVCDWCGWEQDDARQLLSLLVRKNALTRDGRGYRKSAPFIELLKGMRGSAEMESRARPGWVREVDQGATRRSM
jgi:hypothetical protein